MSFVYPSFLWAFLLLSILIALHFSIFKEKNAYMPESFLRTLEKERKMLENKKPIGFTLRIMAISCLVLALASHL